MKKKFAISITIGGKDKLSKATRKGVRGLGKLKLMAKATGRSLRRLGAGALRVGRAMGRMAKTGFLVAAGAATAFVLGVNRVADGMDELAKKTRAINFPIEEFQEWRFAFQQAGVDGDKFTASMGKFTKNLGEAQGGYGALTTSLKKTNPELLKQLKTTDDTSKAFELYIKAIREAPTAAKKAALANAAFGRSGLDMINGANLSAEALAGLRKEMRENGVVTAKQAAAAEEYNDMMNRVKLTLSSLAVDALAPLMPKMTKLADGFRKWINTNRELIQQRVEQVFEAISNGAQRAIEWISQNREELKEFGRGVLRFGETLLNITKWAIKNKEAVLGIVAAIGAIKVTAGIIALLSSLKSIVALAPAAKAAGMAGAGGAAAGGGLLAAAGTAAAGAGAGFFGTRFLAQKLGVFDKETKFGKGQTSANEKYFAQLEAKIKSRNISKEDLTIARGNLQTMSENRAGIMGGLANFMAGDRASGRSTDEEANRASQLLEQLSTLKPAVNMGQSQETVKKEKVELVIRDESGKSEVTQNTAGDGLTIVQTGAM
jgi:hypothetical protein